MLGEEADNIPFAIQFMNSVSLYQESNSRNKLKVLIELYKLQRLYSDFEKETNDNILFGA